MSRNHIWLKVRLTESKSYRMQEYCWLSDLGLLEVFRRSVEHYVCNGETKYLISPVKHLFDIGIALI